MLHRITRTIPYILSIAANAAYFAILRIEMFTERYHLPTDGGCMLRHSARLTGCTMGEITG